MVNQFPRPAFEPEDVGRALIELDHRTFRRSQLAGLDADRIAYVLSRDDGHVPGFDIAAGIEPSHVLKSRVDLIPSLCVASRGAQARDIGLMGPDGAHRSEVAMQGAVERCIEE